MGRQPANDNMLLVRKGGDMRGLHINMQEVNVMETVS